MHRKKLELFFLADTNSPYRDKSNIVNIRCFAWVHPIATPPARGHGYKLGTGGSFRQRNIQTQQTNSWNNRKRNELECGTDVKFINYAQEMKNPPACVLKCSPKRDNFNHLNFTPRLSYRVSDCASFELLKTSPDAMFSLKNMLALIAGLGWW